MSFQYSLRCKVTGASHSYSWDKTPERWPTICPSLIKVEHMLMQPLCRLRVLLLSQGQNWIAPGDCIFPYAWHFDYIMSPHVCPFYIFLPFSSEIFLGKLKKKKKNISPQLLFPYLTYFSFIHNYCRVIYSQDIHIPDLKWHWWFVGDTEQISMILPGARSCFFESVSALSRSKILLHPTSKLLLQVLEARAWTSSSSSDQRHCQAESSFLYVGQAAILSSISI